MMNLEWVLEWYNLIFIVPFLLAMLYLGMFVATGAEFGEGQGEGGDAEVGEWGGGDAEADVDADADAEVDVDADADADGDVDGVAEISHSVDHHAGHAEAGSSVPFYLMALSWLGLGRVPLSLMIMLLLLAWGMIGFISNYAFLDAGSRSLDSSVPPVSMGIAAVGSVLFTALFARVMGRFVPLSETYVSRRQEFLGQVGEAMLPIDHDFGMVFLHDRRGDVFQVPGRVFKDGQPIEKGTKVVLVGYNGKQRVFYVKPHGATGPMGPANT